MAKRKKRVYPLLRYNLPLALYNLLWDKQKATTKRRSAKTKKQQRRYFKIIEVNFDRATVKELATRDKVTEWVQKNILADDEYIYFNQDVTLVDKQMRADRYTVEQRMIAKFLKDRIPDNLLLILEAAAIKFEEEIAKEEKNTNERGEITKFTFHLGCWARFNESEYAITTSETVAGINFLTACTEVFAEVDRILRVNAPSTYSTLVRANQQWPTNLSPCKSYKSIALNLDGKSKFHLDHLDYFDGYCLVIPFGKFTGGDLAFPQISTALQAKRGDVVLFHSAQLVHGNLDNIGGNRRSIVFFTHDVLVRPYIKVTK